MKVELRESALSPWQELQDFEQEAQLRAGGFGATASFIGTMRDFNQDDEVASMFLEHYPGMTEKHLQRIAAEAMERWQLQDLLLIHRVGEVLPGDSIVVIAVWSAHRKEAFEACRNLMETLKSEVPFWKKEQLPSGHRWVEKNTEGY